MPAFEAQILSGQVQFESAQNLCIRPALRRASNSLINCHNPLTN